MTNRASWMPSQAVIEQEVESSYFTTETDYGTEHDMSLDGLDQMIYSAGLAAKIEALEEILPLVCPECAKGTAVWGYDHEKPSEGVELIWCLARGIRRQIDILRRELAEVDDENV